MNTTQKTFKLFWQHAWQYPKYVIGLLVMTPIGLLTFRLVPPLIAAHVLQRLAQEDYTHGDVWGSFGQTIIFYSIMTILGGVLAYRIIIFLIWKLEAYVLRDIYRTMFDHYMKLSSSFHANSFGGSLVSRTSKLAGSYIRLADTFFFQFYPLIISLLFVAAVLYSRVPLFVWSLLIFAVLFIIFTIILSRRVRDLSALEANSQNKVTGNLADAITNVLAIKSFSAAQAEKTRFGHATEHTRHRTGDVMWASTKRDFFAAFVTTTLLVMALVVSIIAVVVYKTDVASVFLMLTYAAFLSDQLWTFSSTTLRNFNRAIGDAQEAVLTLEEKPEVADPIHPETSKITIGSVEFQNVSFDHESDQSNEESLFQDFNLKIQAGEKIGLIGRSGGGKTTLTKLLMRFMDIDDGQILVDGQNIAQLKQDDLRQSMTYVPQEPLLFHRSLSENIRYGNPHAQDEDVVNVARLSHAHEFIEKLPQGYETLVGERGVKLSGGQKQRVAIARAMIKDAPILLLDEATSALDSESEKLIQDALWKLMEGKTAIVIAHRLSTVQKMDRILVLENGKIVEEGTHTNLLKNGGIYSELWKHQSGGFLED